MRHVVAYGFPQNHTLDFFISFTDLLWEMCVTSSLWEIEVGKVKLSFTDLLWEMGVTSSLW